MKNRKKTKAIAATKTKRKTSKAKTKSKNATSRISRKLDQSGAMPVSDADRFGEIREVRSEGVPSEETWHDEKDVA